MAEQVITLSAANAKDHALHTDSKGKGFPNEAACIYERNAFRAYEKARETTGVLDDELNQEIVNAALEFKKNYES